MGWRIWSIENEDFPADNGGVTGTAFYEYETGNHDTLSPARLECLIVGNMALSRDEVSAASSLEVVADLEAAADELHGSSIGEDDTVLPPQWLARFAYKEAAE